MYETCPYFTALASSVEDRSEISVRSSFQLDLPPHLIISSSSIQLNETIGQGNASYTLAVIVLLTVLDDSYKYICLELALYPGLP